MACGISERYTSGVSALDNEDITKDNYNPKTSPVKKVYIPKDNGDKRGLGMPTVIDRTVRTVV